MNYEASSLVYRLCFLIYDGMRIQHDSISFGYILNNSETAPASMERFPTSYIIAAVMVAVVSITSIVYFKKRNH
jgi:hypothetical protein